MEKVLLKDISAYLDQEITLRGWVFNLRSSGSIAFLQLRDGSGFIQAIVSKKEVSPEIWGLCEKITIETSVELTGKVSKHPKKEEYELQVKNINLIQIA